MSKEREEHKKAKAESDRVTAEVLLELAKERLTRSSGEAFVRSILSKSSKKSK